VNTNAADVRVVLFDVGGVLVELVGVDAILRWRDNDLSVEQLWHLWLHSPAVRAFETGRIAADEFAARMVVELQVAVTPQHFLEQFETWPARLYPDALPLLDAIPRRYARVLLSNSNDLHWARVLHSMGLHDAVDRHFSSHLIGKIKPDAEAFEHVFAELHCTAEQVLFLDDNQINVHAARALGMQAQRVQGAIEARQALLDWKILPH
jgi:glucose-1-phosphatase